MKRFFFGLALLLILGGTAARLVVRWREESADRRLSLVADWSELRDAAKRQGLADAQLLERLSAAGANTLLLSPATIQDYLVPDMTFTNRALAEAIGRQLDARGVVGVSIKKKGRAFTLVNSVQPWEALKDLELGFNPELMGQARQAGFHIVLRINQDPWLSRDGLFAELSEITSANQEVGFLLNTDDEPGGSDAIPAWATFIPSQGAASLLFEFHPSKSAVKMALKAPQVTYRAHTIPPAERKDLTPGQELSRWRRAVQERSCRFLLFHMSPSDSMTSFFENIYNVRQDFLRSGWEIAWPRPRLLWTAPNAVERLVNPLLALILAIVSPIVALRANLTRQPWNAYSRLFLFTLFGALVMAALADNPYTRLEIVPFRGVKLAFALAWLGSILMLYTGKEFREELQRPVRRLDLVFGAGVLALGAYFLLRTGNAGSGWKAVWEQSVRDRLEFIFVARPRFKEFVLGYPLLFLGLQKNKRLWIALGMIGPISMVNTFCHLHSPLYLGIWRSANGFVLGTLIGMMLQQILRWRS